MYKRSTNHAPYEKRSINMASLNVRHLIGQFFYNAHMHDTIMQIFLNMPLGLQVQRQSGGASYRSIANQ